MRPHFWLVIALGVPALAAQAQAETLAEHLGQPGTPEWEQACLDAIGEVARTPTEVENLLGGWETADASDATSQLEPCDASNDPLACMHRVTMPLQHYPNAVCSDGSPGTFYIRPGTTHANKWMIHLQGGGACQTYQECAERWCGVQGVYSAAKMSSNWEAPDPMGTLILLPNLPELLYTAQAHGPRTTLNPTLNHFSGWTHVFVYYCSSDGWLGRASDVTMHKGPMFLGDEFTVHARGHTILAILRKMLRGNGPSATDWHPWALSDENCDPAALEIDADACVPDLDDAEEIMLTGTSAGAFGAIQSADWFFEPFTQARTALAIDANISPTDAVLDALDVRVEDPLNPGTFLPYKDTRADVYNAQWVWDGYMTKINAFIDESCELHKGVALGRWDLCSHVGALLQGPFPMVPEVQTETFIRFDLLDPLAQAGVGIAGENLHLPDGSGGYAPLDGSGSDFANLARETLLDLYLGVSPVTGVIGPRCGKHVGFEDNIAFFLDRTMNVVEPSPGVYNNSGFRSEVNSALNSWFSPGAAATTSFLKVDGPLSTSSLCF